jgi:hypothetical protein
MKLIDEKGKLFGKINIIDIFVLIVILLVIGVAGYKFGGSKFKGMFGETTAPSKNITFTVRLTVRNEAIAQAIIKNIHPKDQLIASSNYINAFIESAGYNPSVVTGTNAEGIAVNSNDPQKKDVFITVTAKSDPSSLVTKLGTQDVLLNNSFTVKTKYFSFAGTIESLEIK